jgi:SSS family solute:Na+ symporter
MWRVARRENFHTVGDFLEWRYSATVRATVATLLWLGTLALLAAQLLAMAAILEAVAGIPHLWGAVLAGLVMIAYFMAGGLLSSAWVNLVQLVVLVAGFAVALPMAVAAAGGGDGLLATSPTGEYWDVWRSGGSGWPYVPLLVPAFILSPGLIQKAYGARDEAALRRGVGLSALALLAFAAVPPLLGIAAQALTGAGGPPIDHPDLALPTLLAHHLPLHVGTLGLAAVLSAEISSADAILFMLSTSLSKDLYARFVHPGANEERLLRVARLAALAGGLLAVGLAVVLPSVIGSLRVFYSLLGVSLFVPILAGIHGRRPEEGAAGGMRFGTREAMVAIVVGTAVLLGMRLTGSGLGVWTPELVALLASSGAAGIVALAGRRQVLPPSG